MKVWVSTWKICVNSPFAGQWNT